MALTLSRTCGPVLWCDVQSRESGRRGARGGTAGRAAKRGEDEPWTSVTRFDRRLPKAATDTPAIAALDRELRHVSARARDTVRTASVLYETERKMTELAARERRKAVLTEKSKVKERCVRAVLWVPRPVCLRGHASD